MLAAGLKASPAASKPEVRPVCSIIPRPVAALGSWNPGRQYTYLTWGLSPRCHSRAAPVIWAARGLPVLSCISPIPATSSGAYRELPARTVIFQQSVIIAARPGISQGYFDKCSLTCHLKFGFISPRLPGGLTSRQNCQGKQRAFHFGTCSRVAIGPLGCAGCLH
jgi:hypothetical protein